MPPAGVILSGVVLLFLAFCSGRVICCASLFQCFEITGNLAKEIVSLIHHGIVCVSSAIHNIGFLLIAQCDLIQKEGAIFWISFFIDVIMHNSRIMDRDHIVKPEKTQLPTIKL